MEQPATRKDFDMCMTLDQFETIIEGQPDHLWEAMTPAQIAAAFEKRKRLDDRLRVMRQRLTSRIMLATSPLSQSVASRAT